MRLFTLSNRKIRYLGLGTLVALIGLMSILGIFYISSLEREIKFIEEDHRERLREVDHVLSEFIEIKGELTTFVIEEKTNLKPIIERNNSLIAESREILDSLLHDDDRKQMNQFITKLKEYKVGMVAYSQELLIRRTGEGVRSWERTLLDIENQAHTIGLELKKGIRDDISQLQSDILRRGETARKISILLAIVGVLSGLFVALMLQRALSKPIQELVRVTREIAGGDLNRRVHVQSDDEIGELGIAFNRMTEKLSGTLISKSYLDSIIKSIADVLFVIDPRGIIKQANQAALDILGYSMDEFVGSSVKKICAQDGQNSSHEFMEILARDGSIRSYETTCKTKKGHIIPTLLSGAVMTGENGSISDFVIVAKDITDRKQAEEQLIAAHKKAEEANTLKSEFLANMSHEIRTPMNAIIGMAAIALDTELNREQQDYLTTIQTSSYALLNVINDILDFSKMEAGKLSIDKTDFNLRLTVEAVADTLAHQASEKKLELACLVHHEVPSLLVGDPARVRQILLNLGTNALKFTHKGEVVIRAEPMDETDDTVTVSFSVSDTGIGIPEDKQSMIFDDFVQADGSTTRTYGGTGLGLPISKRLVELMGGEIGVESTLHGGSTFRFSLTFEKQKKEETAAVDLVPDLKNMRVLIADDNETNRKILVRMVESFGCRAEAVPGGAEAVRVLKSAAEKQDPFKFLLLDMMMPGMDGEHATIVVKNTPSISDVSIIILTSLGSRGDVAQMHSLGCAGYLVKPVKQSLLQDTIISILKGNINKEGSESTEFITRHSIAEKKYQDSHILLVEDNPVNQKMASTMLKKAGYAVDIAENGRLAVAAVSEKKYDLILMDIQMPEMDGFEATRAIRDREEDDEHRIIIAMTAHAMEGDRQRCIDAGMDDYIAKPINPQKMFSTIKKWIKIKVDQGQSETDDEGIAGAKDIPEDMEKESPVDMQQAMSRFGDDRAFFREMVTEFLNYIPEQIRLLEEAVRSGDASAVQKNAHSIKGAAGNLSAQKIFSTALQLENTGRNGDKIDARALLEVLKSEILHLEKFLENI